MHINVRCFAIARQLVAADSIEVELPELATVAELRAALLQAHPALAPVLPGLLIAVDSEYATEETPLSGASEVALIPPVSGGSRG